MSDQVPAWAVPLFNMVEYIYKEMKKMDTDSVPEPSTAEPLSLPPEDDGVDTMPPDFLKPEGVEDVGGNADKETIDKLNTVFGK